jgi:hypothetical protein
VSNNRNLDKLDQGRRKILPLARAEWRTVPIMIAAMSFFTLVLSMVVVVYAAWEAREARIHIKAATECLIEQFAEHRGVNRSAHQAFAEKLQAPYTLEPSDLPEVPRSNLETACNLFTKNKN